MVIQCDLCDFYHYYLLMVNNIALFDESVKSWNVSKLDNLLNSVNVELPGVNTPYLYFGMWKATFAWHLEVKCHQMRIITLCTKTGDQ